MATNLLIAWDNLVSRSATTVTASSSDPLQPAVLVTTGFRQNKWHSTSNTSQWIRFSWGSAQNVGAVIIQDHNLTADAVVMLQGSDDGVTWVDLFPINITGNPSILYVEDQYYAHHGLAISDPTNTSFYIAIGHIFMGTYLECSKNYDYGWSRVKKSLSEKQRTPNGVQHIARRPSYTLIELKFTNITDDQKLEIEYFTDSVDIHTPFFVTLDHDYDLSETTDYVTLVTQPTYVNIPGRRYWEFSLQMEEEL